MAQQVTGLIAQARKPDNLSFPPPARTVEVKSPWDGKPCQEAWWGEWPDTPKPWTVCVEPKGVGFV